VEDSNTGPSLVFIFGPAAVGKMTVGQALQKLTGFRLLYNHLVVDLVTEFFDFGTPGFQRLARPFTLQIIEACADQGVGLIITHGLLFDSASAAEILREWSAPYRLAGGAVCHVELSAPLEVRLQRNKSENRRRHKKLNWATEQHLREMESWGRWHSLGELPSGDRHLIIDNSELPAEDAAQRIVQAFSLQVRPSPAPEPQG
jgi:hypothetical protein